MLPACICIHSYTLEVAMQSFADMSVVTGQATGGEYGVVSSTSFQTTSLLTGSSAVTAYAVTGGHVAVLKQPPPSSGPQLVNLILSPTDQPVPGFTPVKYFIYRGLRESDFVGNPGKLLLSTTPGLSKVLTELYAAVDSRTGTTNTELPEEHVGLGLSLSDTDDLDDLFYPYKNTGGPSFSPPFVETGWELGKFDPTSFGFEIVLEGGDFIQTVGFARAASNIIDVSAISGLERRAAREQIRYFVDPAAYYGLSFPTDSSVYTDVISKFDTANTVYLDIRGENDYSYNFYENYSGTNLKTGFTDPPTAGTYNTDDWPIKVIQAPSTAITEGFHSLYVGLLRSANPEPLLVIEYGEPGSSVESGIFFTNKIGQLGPLTPWTNPVIMKIPNVADSSNRIGVATVVKLYYTRRSPFENVLLDPIPAKVVGTRQYNDNLFGPLETNTPFDADTNALIRWNSPYAQKFVDAKGLSSPALDFSGMYSRGVAYEEFCTVFYALRSASLERATAYPSIPASISSAGSGNFKRIFDDLVRINMPTHTRLFRFDIVVPGTSDQMGLLFLDLSSSASTDERDNVLALCLTNDEVAALKNLSGFSEHHFRYLVLDTITSVTATGVLGGSHSCFQAEVKVRGLDTASEEKESGAATPIMVYSYDGRVFVSPGYTDLSPDIIVSRVKIDYEEYQCGSLTIPAFLSITGTPDPHIPAPVNAVPKAIIQSMPEIEKIVYGASGYSATGNTDSFRGKLIAGISSGYTFEQFRSLMETEGKNLYTTASDEVKETGYPNPDDRPLYWARLVMRLDLKDFSNLVPNTQALLEEFEWHSRGFSSVDFSTGTAGKKLLISGFDTFQLNLGIKKSNLAGCIALALRDVLLTEGVASADVRTVVFPVRWHDLTDGLAERFFSQFINEVDAIITVSWMPTLDAFHFDRFAAQYRSNGDDNVGRKHTAQFLHGDAFYETTLPVAAVMSDLGYMALPPAQQKARYAQAFAYTGDIITNPGSSQTVENVRAIHRYVYNSEHKIHEVHVDMNITVGGTSSSFSMSPSDLNRSLPETVESQIAGLHSKYVPRANPSNVQQMFSSVKLGSGGSYISNEIFYRVARLRSEARPTLPTGHLHVNNAMNNNDFDSTKTKNDIEAVIALLKILIHHI